MIRLHFVVEGQTEEEFVNQLLAEHLAPHEVICDARCVLTSRQGYRQFRGGVSKYSQVQRDLQLWMKEDQAADARFTTMIDLSRISKSSFRPSSRIRPRFCYATRPNVVKRRVSRGILMHELLHGNRHRV